jgi:hypothetical protein
VSRTIFIIRPFGFDDEQSWQSARGGKVCVLRVHHTLNKCIIKKEGQIAKHQESHTT